jgi:hypothetical protein
MEIRIALNVLFLGLAASEVSFSEDATHLSFVRSTQVGNLTNSAPPIFAHAQGQDGKVLPALLYDRDFSNDPLLEAEASQAVVFTFGQLDGVGRFNLKAGTHQFFVEGGGGHFRSIELQSGDGQTAVLTLERSGCAQAYLPEGTVSLRLGYRDGPNPRLSAMHRPCPRVLRASCMLNPCRTRLWSLITY